MEHNSKIESIDGITVSSSVLEKLLMVSDRRIRQLTADGILLRHSKGKYTLVDSIQSYIKYLKITNSADAAKAKEDLDYDTEKALHERIKRLKSELQLEVMQGKLYKAVQIEQVMGDILTAFKAKMLNIPSKSAPVLANRSDPGYIRDILLREVTEALNELKDYNPEDFYDKDFIVFKDHEEDED